MIDKRLTAKQVKEILESNKYVILTHWRGWEIGINGLTSKIKRQQINFTKSKLKMKTRFVSFRPCSLNEYINVKGYFIES